MSREIQKNDWERVGHTAEGAALTELIKTIFTANGRMLRGGDMLGRDLGVTAARWQVIGAITFTPKTVAQIARDYEMTRQGILWVVQAMRKEGLVELIDNPDHRRAKLVRLTQTGQEIERELTQRQCTWVNRVAADLNLQDLQKTISYISEVSTLIAGDRT